MQQTLFLLIICTIFLRLQATKKKKGDDDF